MLQARHARISMSDQVEQPRVQEKSGIAVWLVAAMLFMMAISSAYVAAYFFRGQRLDMDNYAMRIFPSELEECLFEPATRIESALSGQEVVASSWVQK